MIVPMKKYSFLIYHREYDKFLNEIQDLGVVHVIEKTDEVADEIRNKIQLIKRIEHTVKNLKSRGQEAKNVEVKSGQIELIEDIEELYLDIDHNTQKCHVLRKELNSLEPWGDLSLDQVKKLSDSDIEMKFFICSEKAFDEEWTNRYAIEIITKANNIYFVVFVKKGEEIDIKADEFKLPDRSMTELKTEIGKIHAQIELDNKQLDKHAAEDIIALTNFKNDVENRKEFEQIQAQGAKEAEGRLVVVEGWIPETDSAEMVEYLETNKVLFLEGDPSEEEIAKVPIKIKNNKFAEMFEPIGKLFSLPAYTEIDLTMYFAPFFMLFFGFCLGDTGYGFVILLAMTILKFKVPKEYKSFLTLGQLFGITTIIMGAVGGTVFGVDLKIIEWKFKDVFLDSNDMFWLALGLGVIQILFGMIIKAANAVKQNGWMYAISTFGWMLLLISLLGMSVKAILGYLKVEESVINSLAYLDTISGIAGKTALVGVAMILLFNDPKANIFVRLGKGLWELYDITGLFGDVLSYIRLFALGVSSAILGLVINNIALEFSKIPYIGWIIMAVFMIIGHTGNILLSGLGSLVHPMRLTFVEFYKNAGWTGGGKEYKPFVRKK
ncbi:MAG: V-type ATP synthase subunit I [Candidatus Delongbacteria bacterium]|nr:V-type ATP synthase subunit I [Candidatus Delongbacteria bacterium]